MCYVPRAMRNLGKSILEVFITTSVSWRLTARTAKNMLRDMPLTTRRGAVVVNRDGKYALIRAADLIIADDNTEIVDLPRCGSICKLSDGEPDCRPLYTSYGFTWLQRHLSRSKADFLFLGVNFGHIRLATVFENKHMEAQTPYADCYCPACKTGYMIGDLPDHGLCLNERQPLTCL